jgi:hypothetical protein
LLQEPPISKNCLRSSHFKGLYKRNKQKKIKPIVDKLIFFLTFLVVDLSFFSEKKNTLESKMNQTPVELKRDTASKFNKVTGRRHSALLLQPISICPAVDITEFPMLRCSFEEEADEPTLTTTTSTEQPQLLRRSLAKYNLTTKNQHQAQPKISHRQSRDI